MKMKRPSIARLAAVLSIALALPLSAAGTAEKKPAGTLKIAYIRPTKELYYTYGFEGAQMMAGKIDVVLLDFVSEMKPDREQASVHDAIAQKVDGIVLAPVNAASLGSSVNAAFDAKIPLYALFGYSEGFMGRMLGSVQPDVKASSGVIGKWVAQNIPQGQVACIMGLPGRGDAEMYRDAFQAEMEKNTNLKLVASVPGDWNRQKAFTQMQNLITSYPSLKAVFVQNEDMALGALQALKEAGKADQVAIVSQNGAPYGLESIAAGGIRATVGWSPSQEAQLALRMLVESIRSGKVPPKLTISPTTLITKDNVSAAIPWEPTAASTDATMRLDISKLQHDFVK